MTSSREVSLIKSSYYQDDDYEDNNINNNNNTDIKRKTSCYAPSSSSPPAKNGIMQTIAGVMGNVLEWYDFALFGFFSDIIAQVFFPPSNNSNMADNDDAAAVDFGAEIDTSNLINSFAVYGGGKYVVCYCIDNN